MATRSEDDARLLAAWNLGDQAAGAELFGRYYAPVLRFYRNKVGPQAADLVQRCFLRCLEVRGKLREGGSFRCFVFGVARNVLLEHYRRMRSDGRIDFSLQTVEDLSPTPTSELAKNDDSRRLLEALRRLPLSDQVVLELFYWEQLSSADIGDALGIPRSTVRSRLRLARERLRGHLDELARDAHELESTMDGLDRWADELRARLAE